MKPRGVMVAAVALGVVQGIYTAVLTWNELPLNEDLLSIGMTVVYLLTGGWVHADMVARGERPHLDLLLMYYVLWFPLMPMYLYRTRGARGFLVFAGFLALLFLPALVEMSVWALMPEEYAASPTV